MQFTNVRTVRSPNNASSPNYDMINSILIAKTSSNDSGKRLSYEDLTKSQFLTESMIQTNNPNTHTYSNHNITLSNNPRNSYIRQQIKGNYNVKESLVAKDRLQNICRNFLNFFGSNGVIPRDRVPELLRGAYHKDNREAPQANSQNTEGLHNIYDTNKDGRISIEDMMSLATRYLSFENKKVVYTRHVQEKLDVARRLFKMFDTHKRGYLTEKEVPYLLKQTYRALGNNDFVATTQDVKTWMLIVDEDRDGKVRLDEYEASIIRSLKKQGVKIYDDL